MKNNSNNNNNYNNNNNSNYNNDNNLTNTECPFKCIFSKNDYLDVIRELVQDKNLELDALNEMASDNLIDKSAKELNLELNVTNLLPVIRLLESIWRENDSQIDIKDLGRVDPKLRTTKDINWYQVCRDIQNYHMMEECGYEDNKDLEFEPTLNKESAARAQDVFVINLPTLQLQLNDRYNFGENKQIETAMYRGFNIPKELMQHRNNEEKADILQKVIEYVFCN